MLNGIISFLCGLFQFGTGWDEIHQLFAFIGEALTGLSVVLDYALFFFPIDIIRVIVVILFLLLQFRIVIAIWKLLPFT